MMGQINIESTAEEVEDFILYHRYISSDENYPVSTIDFLWEAEDIVTAIPKSEPVPKELIEKLIEMVGNEYDG